MLRAGVGRPRYIRKQLQTLCAAAEIQMFGYGKLRTANSELVADWHSHDCFDTRHAFCCFHSSAIKKQR